MTKSIFFTPGPSQVYFTAEDHVKKAFQEGIPSISHRSAQFKAIFNAATENLRTLLNVPNTHHIAFTSSATEIWERIIQNLVHKSSHHYVNGSFSERFAKIASQLHRNPSISKAELGKCPLPKNGDISPEVELISFTQNETSTGAAYPLEEVYKISDLHTDKLIALDVVSSTPYINIDFSKVDTAYFSVQKCFGLPAGLGVWIYNDKCLTKAVTLAEKGISLGSYHTLQGLHASALKSQTPETPNVLNLYLLANVAGDMLSKGIDKIRQETEQKAAILYHLFNNNPNLSAFVKNEAHQSKTVGVAEVSSMESSKLIGALKDKGLIVGSGYGPFKNEHIRIANFPTHSKEQIEMLVDTINMILPA